jgi:hypothetical protein
MITKIYGWWDSDYFDNFIDAQDSGLLITEALKPYDATVKITTKAVEVTWHDETLYTLFVLTWS